MGGNSSCILETDCCYLFPELSNCENSGLRYYASANTCVATSLLQACSDPMYTSRPKGTPYWNYELVSQINVLLISICRPISVNDTKGTSRFDSRLPRAPSSQAYSPRP